MTERLQVNPLNLTSLRDEVYDLLRRRILNRNYLPGYRFDLSTLETQLGISRTPLKEAMQRLERDGLVEIRPRRGTFVTRLDPSDVAEGFDVRQILECAAAKIVAQKVTDEEIAKFQAIHDEMTMLLESDDYQAIVQDYIELDSQLHHYLVELTQNKRLQAVYQHIDTHLQIARVRQKFSSSDSSQTQKEHEAMIVALKKRDAEAFCAAVETHISLSKDRTLMVLDDDK
ncbi:Transcriptional regulator, GntR family [hydrothermal vent metagenome]|uniref:Transcriptional regulator, GntR family n=1 Tax=hydrothermal vent metagenome TaxID=652676 RepID=A0A3B1ASL7_9ZZZZ